MKYKPTNSGETDIQQVFNHNKEIVNYFTSCQYWVEVLERWRLDNDVSHGLKTWSESRFYNYLM